MILAAFTIAFGKRHLDAAEHHQGLVAAIAFESLVKLVASSLRQHIDELIVDTFGYDGLQLATERPLYGNESPEPIGSKPAQLAMPTYLNSRAWTIFGGSNEVQKNIIAKSVLGL